MTGCCRHWLSGLWRLTGLGEFPLEHVRTISEAGLLGLTVPVEYGGLGGGLRDLSAATFAMATACPSTSLAYFFQCSGSSRGLLPLAAIEAGLFADDEVPVVRAFGEKVLRRMGEEGRWVANFASESVRSKNAAVTIATEASRTDGGWLINGVKSFGCATGVADDYLVTAKLDTGDTAEHLAVFLIPRDTPGVSERTKWDAIGMRATATHGIVLENAFVPDENALTVPATFVKMTQVSRGSFVGNQVALSSVYIGAAQAVYDFALRFLTTTTYHGTDEPIGGSDLHRQLLGKMRAHLDTAYLWARRQILLETADPEIIPKDDVVANWRIAKGEIADNCFQTAVQALKACGTGNTGMEGVDLSEPARPFDGLGAGVPRRARAGWRPPRISCSARRATNSAPRGAHGEPALVSSLVLPRPGGVLVPDRHERRGPAPGGRLVAGHRPVGADGGGAGVAGFDRLLHAGCAEPPSLGLSRRGPGRRLHPPPERHDDLRT